MNTIKHKKITGYVLYKQVGHNFKIFKKVNILMNTYYLIQIILTSKNYMILLLYFLKRHRNIQFKIPEKIEEIFFLCLTLLANKWNNQIIDLLLINYLIFIFFIFKIKIIFNHVHSNFHVILKIIFLTFLT